MTLEGSIGTATVARRITQPMQDTLFSSAAVLSCVDRSWEHKVRRFRLSAASVGRAGYRATRLMFHVKHDLVWTADTSGYKSHEYG